jgi:hypothetical protein
MPSFSFEVEYAKSGRAACKKCKDKIDKDAVRVGFKADVPEDAEGAAAHFGCSWHHFACFPQAKGASWFKKHLTAEVTAAGVDALKSEDQEAVAQLFKACRGEVPVPDAPKAGSTDAAVAAVATPVKASKKRKGKGGDAGDDEAGPAKAAKAAVQPALTDAQLAAIAEAKTKLASKNAAFLGAVLTKNGLPKAGRKDELIDRVAENQVLGVPPMCDVCDKKKLSWSRATGKFSCPGFFDDEAKSFKRCKGPSAGADLARSPWVGMDA